MIKVAKTYSNIGGVKVISDDLKNYVVIPNGYGDGKNYVRILSEEYNNTYNSSEEDTMFLLEMKFDNWYVALTDTGIDEVYEFNTWTKTMRLDGVYRVYVNDSIEVEFGVVDFVKVK